MSSRYWRFSFWRPDTGSYIDTKKKLYLQEGLVEAISAHPENEPRSLICPISLTLMKEPVITEEGHVYDKDNILKYIEQGGRDPFTRNLLSIDKLHPFPELLTGPIQVFVTRQKNYSERKQALLSKAWSVAHSEQLEENPSLFICPISKIIMKVPVITRDGEVYDKQSLDQYLCQHNSIEETKVRTGLEDYQLFPEFRQQIRVFLLNRKEKMAHSAQDIGRTSLLPK